MNAMLPALAVMAAGCAAPPERGQDSGDASRRVQWTVEDPAAMRSAVVDSARVWMVSGHIPGAVIGYVQDGAVSWVDPIGTLAAGGSARVEPGTVFEAASLGKPLFAYGVMKLAARGALDLDAPLGRYLPARIQGAVRDSGVTVARVLSHSSGLDLDPQREALALAFEPGSGWGYSSVAYVLLQLAVENVTGMPLEDWMQREVISPLGMTRTSYMATRRKQPGAAEGHDRQGSRLLETPWPQANAASSLHTTAEDYAKFIIASFEAKDLWTPRVVADAPHDLSWGLGWGVAGGGKPVFLQWGSNPGFKSLAVGIPDERRGFVILTNSDNGLELATALSSRLIGANLPAMGFFMLHPDD
jgi:CubicO group peptidase (beta-lactamase class C family)